MSLTLVASMRSVCGFGLRLVVFENGEVLSLEIDLRDAVFRHVSVDTNEIRAGAEPRQLGLLCEQQGRNGETQQQDAVSHKFFVSNR
jgi:hypothetical protein